MVADGMGGHPGGDVASQIACETDAPMLGEAGAADVPSSSLAEHLDAEMTKTVMPAHENIRKRGSDAPELAGMGTTLTALGSWIR